MWKMLKKTSVRRAGVRGMGFALAPALALLWGGVEGVLAANTPLSALQSTSLLVHIDRLMLMALAAVVVVFFRQTLGIRMLGPVRPILIALSFQFTGFLIGASFIIGTMVMIALIRPALRRARISYFGRIAIILNIIALLIILTIKMSQHYQLQEWLVVGMLPVVVLTFASDGFARTLSKEGLRSAAWRAMTTILIAGFVHLLVAGPRVLAFMRENPAVLLVQMLVIVLISKKLNLQLLAFLNPAPQGKREQAGKTGQPEPPPEPEPEPKSKKKSKKKSAAKTDKRPKTKSPKTIKKPKSIPKRMVGFERSQTMKIAVVRNRKKRGILYENDKKSPESYGRKSVQRIIDALRAGGHEIKILEGDITLFDGLKSFIPPDEQGRATGLVFNLSYGIQGDCRYTHLPAMLEMIGIPYTGANPLGQTICLDKVVTKQILQKNGLPTPPMAVLSKPEQPIPAGLRFPLIVKPRHESSSLGVRVVHNHLELVQAAADVIETFKQDALVEEYIDGRELCVGLLGNGDDLQVFPSVEIAFRGREFPVLTKADKFHKSEDEPEKVCPAPMNAMLEKRIEEVARRAFQCCHCRDYARVDMRVSRDGVPYIIEMNSMASLGQGGTFVLGALHAGYDFTRLVNKIAEIAAVRTNLLRPQPAPVESRHEAEPETALYPLQLAVNY